MLTLAVLEYALISKYIYKERVDDLRKNAGMIANYINSGSSVEYMDSFLLGFSRSTGKNIIISSVEHIWVLAKRL